MQLLVDSNPSAELVRMLEEPRVLEHLFGALSQVGQADRVAAVLLKVALLSPAVCEAAVDMCLADPSAAHCEVLSRVRSGDPSLDALLCDRFSSFLSSPQQHLLVRALRAEIGRAHV